MNINILDNFHRIKTIHSVFEGGFSLRYISHINHTRGIDGFIFILRGSAKYTFIDHQFIAHQSNVIFLDKDARYTIELLTDDYRFICINFSFEENFNTKSDVYNVENAQIYEKLFRSADTAWLLNGIEKNAQCFSNIYEIYTNLLTYQKKQYAPKYSRRLTNLQDFIISNLNNPKLNIQNLCEVCDLSEAHLRRLFKRCYGVSPMHFVNQLRIERAKLLLEEGCDNQNKISEICGFSDVYYFGKAFKRICGLSPGKYASMKNERKIQKD